MRFRREMKLHMVPARAAARPTTKNALFRVTGSPLALPVQLEEIILAGNW